VELFKRTEGGVLFAPSVDRGYDFKGDEARVVVVAKLPWANVKDPVVSSRLHGSNSDQEWYTIQMLRGLVQMTGRGVRSDDDWAVTYILDSGFLDLGGRVRELLPVWWLEALSTEMRFKDLCDLSWQPRIDLPTNSKT
jgi:Rad3-related DNA helicase